MACARRIVTRRRSVLALFFPLIRPITNDLCDLEQMSLIGIWRRRTVTRYLFGRLPYILSRILLKQAREVS